jgi:hypothetical protein
MIMLVAKLLIFICLLPLRTSTSSCEEVTTSPSVTCLSISTPLAYTTLGIACVGLGYLAYKYLSLRLKKGREDEASASDQPLGEHDVIEKVEPTFQVSDPLKAIRGLNYIYRNHFSGAPTAYNPEVIQRLYHHTCQTVQEEFPNVSTFRKVMTDLLKSIEISDFQIEVYLDEMTMAALNS